MKKFLSFILAVAMSFSCVGVLSGCSSSSESEEESGSASASVSVEEVEEEAEADESVEEADSSASSEDGYEELTWPVNEMASVLPEPPSLYGEVVIEESDNVYIKIFNIGETEFNEYADLLCDAGFTISIDRGGSYFEGYDENGRNVFLLYNSSRMQMTIDLTVYDYDIANVSDEIIELMEEYESFAYTYADWSERYDELGTLDEALTEEQAELLSEYTELADKLEAIDENDLNEDELMYVYAVSERCDSLLD